MSNRRITLYIDGQRADMSTDSLVLMNYTASDLANPAAVKNSYSQQATLPATPNNDRIFSSIYRADWRAAGSSFNPLIRTPFAIYDDSGDMLESGYLKLNTTTNKNGVRTYVVTLYGGLGSFFYLLSYDDEGNPLSLGDLPLLGNDSTQQIDFRITQQVVADAWARLKRKTVQNAENKQFDVVNFAPAYNGLPTGDFDASKGVGNPALVGGESTVTDDQKNVYTVYGDHHDALYDFGGDFTEWQVKDLRSYMQRPVVSVKALVEAIARYGAARGFTVKLDPAWFTSSNPYYGAAWMTLPVLGTRSVPNKEEGILKITGDKEVYQETGSFIYIPLTPTISSPNAYVTVKCRPQVTIIPSTSTAYSQINFNSPSAAQLTSGEIVRGSVFFVQLQLLDDSGTVVGASPIKVCISTTYSGFTTAQEWVDKANLQACVEKGYGVDTNPTTGSLIYSETPGGDIRRYSFNALGEVSVSAYNAVSARLCIETRAIQVVGNINTLSSTVPLTCVPSAGTTQFLSMLYWGGRVLDGTFEYTTGEQYRSNTRVTQKDLFADMMSPLEFLLSYSKTFGLHYLYDHTRKQVEIVTRNTLYGGRPTVDLQQRIDRSKDITTTPIPMSAKWLEFAPAETEGEFVDYYKSKYGREYGAQRVNTAYEFDAETTDVLENGKFNGGAEVLEQSRYYIYVRNSTRSRIPAPVIDGTTTYKLFRTVDGELQSQETEFPNLTIPAQGFQGFEYFNANHGYDAVPKLQCHGAGNSATDGAGILLIYRGLASEDQAIVDDPVAQAAYKGFLITDDSAAMYALNGKPCWELSTGTAASDMPAFGRFKLNAATIQYSLEFGTPAELDNPVIGIQENTDLYTRFWAAYIADRNDVNTRLCSAHVDLRGLKPGPEMLRDFYYFDGAIWVLNKIVNYSLSTPGTTKCEFVKVQDQDHYAAGQLIDASTYELTLSLRTDGTDLYVSTSRPLAAHEEVMILTRGAGRCEDRRGVYVASGKHHYSRKRWHKPINETATSPLFPIDESGKISLRNVRNSYKWRLDADRKGGTTKYCHIDKANWSRGFGYKAVEGLDKAVTFAVAVYKGSTQLSNRCYFESRCRIRNGKLTQEFVTAE